MATDSSKNNRSPQGKGNPGDVGKSKSPLKDNKDRGPADLNYKAQLADEYTEGIDEPRSDLATNPNRNTDKVNNQSTPYGAKGKE
ncbi:hypothetical protein ADICEAN_04097 [Cesiribacter andamanensis AMV16]|uniref:Uncharacterized protein n=1 Tax=Cesiribacter andamanensis AMV16 TaxID=1279009 RepID=M7NQM2_9BACT|nr:hypothetical protein ADICEAN_04097 [Cesiribacter andamanensis AMV16]